MLFHICGAAGHNVLSLLYHSAGALLTLVLDQKSSLGLCDNLGLCSLSCGIGSNPYVLPFPQAASLVSARVLYLVSALTIFLMPRRSVNLYPFVQLCCIDLEAAVQRAFSQTRPKTSRTGVQHKDLRSVQKQAGRGAASSSGHAATSSPPSARKPLSDEIIQQFLASARRMADECAARNGSPRSADAGNAAFGAARASSHSEDAMAGSVGTANPCPAKDASGSSLSAHVPQTSIKVPLLLPSLTLL